MIIRDNVTPRGRDVGPRHLFSSADLPVIAGGLGYGSDMPWNSSITRRPPASPPAETTHVVYPKIDPAGHEFKATDPRAKWCSHRCQARNWYRANQLKGHKPHPMASCHPNRTNYAKGLCIPCYSRSRRTRVAQGI